LTVPVVFAWRPLRALTRPRAAAPRGRVARMDWWWTRRPALLVLFGAGVVLGMVQSAVLAYLPIFSVQALGFTPVGAGVLIAASQIGGAVARLGLGIASDRWSSGRRPPWLVLTSALGTVIFLVYAWLPTADPLAAALGVLLKERKQTLAVAESSAGGLISATLLAVPGASAYFVGGGVIYTQAARRGLLRVGDDAVKGIRSSSEPYAQLKAKAVRELMGATWGLAETGASGPTGNRYGDAAGHTCLAVVGPLERATTLETGHGDRALNMRVFTRAALELLAGALA